MAKSHISQRYDMEPVLNGYWRIVDLFTGQTECINGVMLDGLELGEADDLVDLLNAHERKRLEDSDD